MTHKHDNISNSVKAAMMKDKSLQLGYDVIAMRNFLHQVDSQITSHGRIHVSLVKRERDRQASALIDTFFHMQITLKMKIFQVILGT